MKRTLVLTGEAARKAACRDVLAAPDGTDDEKDAAREFWEHKRHRNPDAGINDRIRASIAAEKREAA